MLRLTARVAAQQAAGRTHLLAGVDAARCFASEPDLTLTLPGLPYDYGALEPYISGEIMKLHHEKHHQTYVNGFNKAKEQYEEAEHKKDLEKMLALHGALTFNGGGHVNHSIFWKNLAPPKEGGGEPPQGALASAIEKEFGSLDAFITKFSTTAAAVQGSGWGWLGLDKEKSRLVITTTANQDPLSTKGLVPLLGVDVWEHAYYLQYKNVRPEYLKNVWSVVNWKDVTSRFESA